MDAYRKKIGIINHWMVNNYGALFLAYALERKILEMGYDAETISWLPDEVLHPGKMSMIRKAGFVHYVFRLGYFTVFIEPREKSFLSLRSKMHTSKEKYTDATLPQINERYDKILLGGDQLWNCKANYYNENNFLPFIAEKRRKVVYAASLALQALPPEIKDTFVRLAGQFGYITTREETGRRIVEQVLDVPAPRVIDSAFFLSAAQWAELAEPVPGIHEKFLFVYQVQSNVSLIRFAEREARKRNLKIVYCPFPLKKQIRCKRLPYMSPEQWLWCVQHAEYVVTDAFHGTVFSILFKRPFAAEISAYGSDTSSRITDLLHVFKMDDRLLQKGVCPGFDQEIDGAFVDSVIRSECERSEMHLRNMLDL